MTEIEIINTTNLLNQIATIKSKYDDLAEYSGENYNIFNVLNIYGDELSHSAIIGNLLNAKGKHGQKDVFLKLFLEEIQGFEDESNQFKTLNLFKSEQSKVFIEKNIGGVNHTNGEGGRIDILINDGQNNIIIENKVWAGDQNLQLIRYNNHDLNAPILYLTLDGKPPSQASIKHEVSTKNLTLGREFICISYQENIKSWLEKCIKEMDNKPIIRETLNQYLVLVKQLTNQNTNNKMKEDIMELILKNDAHLNSFIELLNLKNEFYQQIILTRLIPDINEIALNLNLKVSYKESSLLNQSNWPGFNFSNPKLEEIGIKISVSAFLANSFSNVCFGITSDNKFFDFEKINLKYSECFNNINTKDHWKCKSSYHGYSDFNNLITLKNIYNGDFKSDLKDKVQKILDIIESSI